MKTFNWPAEGVPAGTTQKLFEDRYREYPFNPIDHGASRVSPHVDDEGFIEVAEAPTGFMAIKRHVFTATDEAAIQSSTTFRTVRPTIRRRTCTGVSSTAWSIPIPGIPVRGLCVLPAMARHGGKIWVDLDCKLMHLGQHLFGGDLAESLRAQGRW